MSTFEFSNPSGHLGGGLVKVDGVDISHSVRGLTLEASVNALPRVTLELSVIDATTVGGDCEILIASETRELLLRAGWTPPVSATQATEGETA